MATDYVERLIVLIRKAIKEGAEESSTVDLAAEVVAELREERDETERRLEEAIEHFDTQEIEALDIVNDYLRLISRIGDLTEAAEDKVVQLGIARARDADIGTRIQIIKTFQRRALDIAEEARGDEVTVDYVIEVLNDQYGDLPWDQPRSAISSILYQKNSRWERTRPGVYRKKEVGEES